MSKIGTVKFLSDSQQIDFSSFDSKVLLPKKQFSKEDSDIAVRIYRSVKSDHALPFPLTVQENHHLAHTPKSQWIDYLVYRYKFVHYPKQKILSDFPLHVLIEPTSVCNLRCVMCYQVDKTFTRKEYMGLMDLGLFREVIDQTQEGGAKSITLASRGEPTLHKDLGKMLEYVSGKFLEVKLTTNATYLTGDLSRTILDTGVNLVVFSVDGHTKTIYESIRVGGNFDEIVSNIQRFHEIRELEYPDSNCLSRISGVFFQQDQNPELFLDYWEPIVDEVGIKHAWERWDTYNNPKKENIRSPCGYLWERMYIWFDGKTNPCDVDYKSYLSGGNIREQTMGEIWKGKYWNQLRQEHLEGCRYLTNPCDRCGVEYKSN